MAKGKYTAEEIVTLLRQVKLAIGRSKATAQACRESGITEQTYYRWRKEYGGLTLEQVKRLEGLERENSQLKRLIAELSLENRVSVAQSTFFTYRQAALRECHSSSSTRLRKRPSRRPGQLETDVRQASRELVPGPNQTM